MAGFFPPVSDNYEPNEDEPYATVNEENSCDNCGAVRFSLKLYPLERDANPFLWTDDGIVRSETPRTGSKCLYCGEVRDASATKRND